MSDLIAVGRLQSLLHMQLGRVEVLDGPLASTVIDIVTVFSCSAAFPIHNVIESDIVVSGHVFDYENVTWQYYPFIF